MEFDVTKNCKMPKAGIGSIKELVLKKNGRITINPLSLMSSEEINARQEYASRQLKSRVGFSRGDLHATRDIIEEF